MSWFYIAWAVLIIGLAIRSGIQEYLKRKRSRSASIRVQGIVIRNNFHPSQEVSVFRPVIRFQTRQGEIIEAEDQHGLALAVPRFSAGTKVVISYEETNPANFRILSEGNLFS